MNKIDKTLASVLKKKKKIIKIINIKDEKGDNILDPVTLNG